MFTVTFVANLLLTLYEFCCYFVFILFVNFHFVLISYCIHGF